MTRREVYWWITGFILLDLVSFLGYYWPLVRPLGFIVVCAVVLVLAVFRFHIAVLIGLAELAVGSFGHLLGLPWLGGELSLRMGIFTILFVVGSWRTVRQWRQGVWAWPPRSFLALLPLGLSIGLAFALGWFKGVPFGVLFRDGNGYLFIGFAVPLLAAATDLHFRQRVVPLILIAAAYLAAKSLVLLYFFTHRFEFFVIDLYQWIRDSGAGELTPTASGVERIFLQSQLYVLIAWWLALWQTRGHQRLSMALPLSLMAMSSATLLISFSRSYWLGLIISLLAYVVWELVQGSVVNLTRSVAFMVVTTFVGVGIILGVLNVPWPSPSSSGSLELADRLQVVEPAASSRWKLLGPLWSEVQEHALVGAGFGSAVTYVSDDPRVRARTPSGLYTTTAFEWGYLGMWLKLGIIGLTAYALVLVVTVRRAWLTDQFRGPFGGLVFGLVALLSVHIASPYLDHPLGLGYVLLVYAVVVAGFCKIV